MKIVGLTVSALAMVASSGCGKAEYYSPNTKACVMAPGRGEYCNVIRTCANGVTCGADNMCDTLTTHRPDKRIDVHYHVLPDFYRDALAEIAHIPTYLADCQAQGFNPETAECSLYFGEQAAFDKLCPIGSNQEYQTFAGSFQAAKDNDLRIEKAILSLPLGFQYFEKEHARELASRANDQFYANTKDRADGDFFASLPPLLDREGVLAEMDRVFTIMGNKKFVILTQYPMEEGYLSKYRHENHNTHQGFNSRPEFDYFWQKLNSIGGIVSVHPTEPNIDPFDVLANDAGIMPMPSVDYNHDTARMAISLVLSAVTGISFGAQGPEVNFDGHLEKYPDAQIIITHAAGALPVAMYRACLIAAQGRIEMQIAYGMLAGDYLYTDEGYSGYNELVDACMESGRKFWYDTSLAPGASIAALLAYLGEDKWDRVFYGSDMGYIDPLMYTDLLYEDQVKYIDTMPIDYKDKLIDMIAFDNADAFLAQYDA